MLGFYVLGGEAVARPVPYSQHADTRAFFGLFLDVKDSAVYARPPAVQQMAGRVAELVSLGNDRAAGRHVGKGRHGRKKVSQPWGRAGGGNLADTLEGRVGVGFGGSGEANPVGHTGPASRPRPARRVSVGRARRSLCPRG